jgi:hypothetical protein
MNKKLGCYSYTGAFSVFGKKEDIKAKKLFSRERNL